MSALVKDFTINARYDLRANAVKIFYETASSINGQESLSLATDFWPVTPPTDPLKQFAVLAFTVDLQGINASLTSAKITTEPISPNDPNWWLQRHPQYRPMDASNPADAAKAVASFQIDASTIQRAANPAQSAGGLADMGFVKELTTGQLTDWMTNFKSQRISLGVTATIVYRNGSVSENVALNYQCLSTNAVDGTYANQQITAYAEPIPTGLAKFIYDAINVLQFEGDLTLQEEDVSGSLSLGNLFNLTGGALAEWTTMAALVQEVTEDIDAGTTTVSFGPPRNLSAGELVDLLRTTRNRLVLTPYSSRAAGTPSSQGGQVDLGQNTPEKNSVAGTAPANPQVISQNVDGSGAVITHASGFGDCSTTWESVGPDGNRAPGTGSITLLLSDAGGQDVSLQLIPICLNGVSGTIRILCGPFTPDA